MRHSGLWHPRLTALVTAMGHGDLLVIADPGLPVPTGVEVVDLVVSRGEPRLMTVLRPVVAELVIEQATLAEELTDAKLVEDVTNQLGSTPIGRVAHGVLKAMTNRATAVVRTGEDTPYANVVLRAGVAF
ncbi:MAG TPA: D-ribose pyranase [Micromonosporaceae bacterium]|jgi:D-ribose pyranase